MHIGCGSWLSWKSKVHYDVLLVFSLLVCDAGSLYKPVSSSHRGLRVWVLLSPILNWELCCCTLQLQLLHFPEETDNQYQGSVFWKNTCPLFKRLAWTRAGLFRSTGQAGCACRSVVVLSAPSPVLLSIPVQYVASPGPRLAAPPMCS